MLLSLCKISCLLSLVLIGCATPWGGAPKIETCLSDPLNSSFACRDKKGESFILPFAESGNYICFPPEEFGEYLKHR